jgi:alpha-beta hydrolase superfamily lysophospholipase
MERAAIKWIRAVDGTELALHCWAPAKPRAALFYIHGIQSHAGWLFETGPQLAARDMAVVALDRRGSGRSGGERGHVATLELLLSDYLMGLKAARELIPDAPLAVLGQSLGGSILAGLCTSGQLRAEALIFCAPALGQQRARHDAAKLGRFRECRGLGRSAVTLKDEDYTEEEVYLRFMSADALMLREVTDSTRSTLVHLEDAYAETEATLRVPTFLAAPERDPIIDLAVARRWLGRLIGPYRETVFATTHHYIEFSRQQESYWDWLAACAIPVQELQR